MLVFLHSALFPSAMLVCTAVHTTTLLDYRHVKYVFRFQSMYPYILCDSGGVGWGVHF